MAEEANGKVDAEQQEPAAKRLRSSDHDLKIIVKDSSNDSEESIEKEYYFHAQVLSNLSKFIDASLSVEMKEKENREIVFHDVSPEVFELAVKFQQDLVAVREMKPEDVMKVAEFYDKYEFTGGLELCDAVLLEYITRNNQKQFESFDSPEPPENLDLLVETIVLADKIVLKKSRTAGIDFLSARLNSIWIPYGRTMFKEKHFKMLMPMLRKDTVRLNFREATREELESPLFPDYIVAALSNWQASQSLGESVQTIAVSGAGNKVDGRFKVDFNMPSRRYESGRCGPWNGREATFSIERDDSLDWAIIGRRYGPGDVGDDFEWVLWKCPCSANLMLPPKGPWVVVDDLARGSPKIEYL